MLKKLKNKIKKQKKIIKNQKKEINNLKVIIEDDEDIILIEPLITKIEKKKSFFDYFKSA
jgi:hypothetical protein